MVAAKATKKPKLETRAIEQQRRLVLNIRAVAHLISQWKGNDQVPVVQQE